MNAGAGNGAANGSNLRAGAPAWEPAAPAPGRRPLSPYAPVYNPNRPAEQLEEAAEMDDLLEEINVRRDMNMRNNTGEMNNLLREINAGRAANMPNSRKSRKGSRKVSRKNRKGSRKVSRKNRKASRKNRK